MAQKQDDADLTPADARRDPDDTASSPEAERLALFLFEYAGKTFAIPLQSVEEVIEPTQIESYPGALPHCRGTISHRGRILPVFDPMGLGFGSEAREHAPACLVIMRAGAARFAFALDRHLELIETPSSEISEESAPPPEAIETSNYLTGLLAHRDRTMALLSLQSIASMVQANIGAQTIINPDEIQASQAEEARQEDFVLSRIGETSIAHPVATVLEIVEGLDVMPLFGVAPCLRGLTNLRGRVLACVDISDVLGLSPRLLDDRSMFLVLSTGNAEFALCVDHVAGIRSLPRDAFQPTEGLLPGSAQGLFEGVVERKEGACLKLSASAIATWDRLAPLRAQANEM